VALGGESAGAAHGSELPYVFGTLSLTGRGGSPSRYEAADTAVSSQMQQYWTNCARKGNLTAILPQWPKFDPSGRAYMELTAKGPVAREGLRREACDLFIDNIALSEQRILEYRKMGIIIQKEGHYAS
jgi:carboxylesterase type B